MVQRAKVRGTADPTRLRRQTERALSGCDAKDLGLPPQALLVLRRIAPAMPLPMDYERVHAGFSRSLETELTGACRQAHRPWLSPGTDHAVAVLFADEAELAACLIREGLRGSLADRWWRPAILEDSTLPEWSRRYLLPRGDLLPPVLALLAEQGWAVPWVVQLGDSERDLASAAIVEAHGLAIPGDREAAGTLAFDGGAMAEPPPIREGPADAWQELARRVPEVRQAPKSRSGVRLLAVALGLKRDPVWTRGAGLRRALSALDYAEGVWTDQLVGSVAAGHLARASRVEPLWADPDVENPARATDVARPRGAGKSAPATHPETPPISAPAKEEGPSTPTPDPAPGPLSGPAPAPAAESPGPARALPDRTAKVVGIIEDAESLEDAAPQPVDVGPGRSRARVTRQLGTELDDRRGQHPGPAHAAPSPDDGDRGQTPASPSQARDGAADDRRARREPASSTAQSSADADLGWSAPTATCVETRWGGLFYLLNLALALGLYGDFTQPLRPGIDLSPWDWLALVGRTWLGRALLQDPLWDLLAQLAGRSAGQPPGTGFAPPVLWSVPEEWPMPWGTAEPISVETRRGHLQLHHPAGFVLADVPREPGMWVIEQARKLCVRWPVLDQVRLQRIPRWPGRRRANMRFRVGWGELASPSSRARSFSASAPGIDLCPEARERLPADPALARWLGWLLPYLEARLALALGADALATVPALVCRHRARVEISATALDVHLSLAELPIALRIAGLDRDPGWIPAAGRSVAFHFL